MKSGESLKRSNTAEESHVPDAVVESGDRGSIDSDYLEKLFGIDISHFDARTQLSVAQFLSERTPEEFVDLADDIREMYDKEEDRENAFRVLLANEKIGGTQFADMLSWYNAVPEISAKIYKKYAEIVSDIDHIEEFVRLNFKSDIGRTQALRIREMLITNAHKILLKHYGTVTGLASTKMAFSGMGILNPDDRTSMKSVNLLEAGKSNKVIDTFVSEHTSRIFADLESISVQQTLFLNSFKGLSGAHVPFSLEDIADSSFGVEYGGSIPESDCLTMRSIYSKNQEDVGAHDEIIAHFDERIQDSATRFYLFRWQGKIQSFVAFSKKGENIFEATSFNVDPLARGYKIGEAMLEEAIAKEAQEHVLYGECYAQLPISAKYIETGWVAEGHFIEVGKEPNTTDALLNIYRDDAHNQLYWGKQPGRSQRDIVSRVGVSQGVEIVEAESQKALPFHLLNEGYEMTRMFKYEPTGMFYGVFEPRMRPLAVKDSVRK